MNFKKILNWFSKKPKEKPAPPANPENEEAIPEKLLFYDDLTPVNTVPDSAPYNDALHWALKNPNIKNIAITGPYGSGKSSVLRTFEDKHPEYIYLNISLASFKEGQVSDVPPIDKTKEQINEESRLIELSIIQQMFYKVADRDIPDSRFKRIKSLSQDELTTNIKYSLLAMFGLLILFSPKFIMNLSWWNGIYVLIADFIYYLAIIAIVPGFIKLLRYAFRVFNGSKLNKLNLSSGEIEINPKSETSILNKHIDEILYFFEVTAFDVVVIEDLDRFNDPEIFTKLREINILINNAAPIASKKIVRFIYAVKDDMFLDKSRTKFFDFIIPVIPVINATNSLDILLKKIEKAKLELDISENFLADITLYIDDMRALKNIFNEFLIYKENLKGVKIKDEKLFAMIVYKNIHPSDFAKLHDNSGEVYAAFESKPKIIEKIIEEKQELIKQIETDNVKSQNANPIKVEELRKLYLFQLLTLIPNAASIYIDSTQVSWADLVQESHFNKLLLQTNILYYRYSYGQENSGVSFQTVEKAVDKQHTYLQRLKQIDDREESKKGASLVTIEKIKLEIAELKQQSLRYLLDAIPNSIDLIGEKFKQMKLIVYLIREGYIDEMYPSLISHFYPGSLSHKDMEFILSVKDREALSFNYELEKIQTICKRLTLAEFGRQEIFNTKLIDILIGTKTQHADKWSKFAAQFSAPNKMAIDFIDDYLINGKQLQQFVMMLCKQWTTMADVIFKEMEFSEEKRERYLKMIIVHGLTLDLHKLNSNNTLSEYINHKENFTQLFTVPEYLKVQLVLKKLNIKFQNLKTSHSKDNTLISFIFDNEHFTLNPQMIELYFAVKLKDKPELYQKLKASNYTTIYQTEDRKLQAYVEKNIEQYVQNVILDQEDNIDESADSVIKLLNNDSLNDGLKTALTETQITTIEDIKKVGASYWANLLENRMAGFNWPNVIAYHQQAEGFDSYLDDFINDEDVVKKLSETWFTSGFQSDPSARDKFSLDFILNPDIIEESFQKITSNYGLHYLDANEIMELDKKKMAVLIENSVIRLSKSNFSLLKEHHPILHIKLIEKNNLEFFKDRTPYKLESGDYYLLLKSTSLNLSQKHNILAEITAEMVEETNELSNIMAELIAQQPIIQREYSLLKSIFEYSSITLDNATIFEMQLKFLDFAQIEELLIAIGEPYNKLAEKHKSPKLPISQLNWSIAIALKERGFVSSIKEEKGLIRINTKH